MRKSKGQCLKIFGAEINEIYKDKNKIRPDHKISKALGELGLECLDKLTTNFPSDAVFLAYNIL